MPGGRRNRMATACPAAFGCATSVAVRVFALTAREAVGKLRISACKAVAQRTVAERLVDEMIHSPIDSGGSRILIVVAERERPTRSRMAHHAERQGGTFFTGENPLVSEVVTDACVRHVFSVDIDERRKKILVGRLVCLTLVADEEIGVERGVGRLCLHHLDHALQAQALARRLNEPRVGEQQLAASGGLQRRIGYDASLGGGADAVVGRRIESGGITAGGKDFGYDGLSVLGQESGRTAAALPGVACARRQEGERHVARRERGIRVGHCTERREQQGCKG